MTRITSLAGCLATLLFATPLAADETPRLDVQSVTFGIRYRMLENHLGSHVRNWSDHHQGLKLRLKLDREARYTLTAAALNGDTFTAGWNLRGLGDRSSNRVFLKQLFLTAKPRKGVEFQYGGLAIARGESSEVTSYDNDGYLMGQRVMVRDLTITAGYLGDLRSPSVTSRAHRLSEVNYVQALVRRQLTDRLIATADITDEDGERTFRQGFVIRPSSKVDLIRLEAYERVSGTQRAGGAITVEKPFGRTRLAASFASVDDHYRLVNGDRYGRGRRLSFTSTTSLGRDVSLQFFVTRALDDDIPMANRMRFDVHLRYELAPALRQMASR